MKLKGLPQDVSYAIRHLRRLSNDSIIEPCTRGTKVSKGPGAYATGFEVTRLKDDTLNVTLWSVNECIHVIMADLDIQLHGTLISGKVNCFGLGWMSADQKYVDMLFDEMGEEDFAWDEIRIKK